jgi:methylmalonyl-CoA epimerase
MTRHVPPTTPDGLQGIVERFDHLALAVTDVAATLAFVEALGGRYLNGGHHPTQRFRWAQFRLPEAMKLELLAPLDPDDADHFLVRFLASRGEGPHHVTFKVADITQAVAEARRRGFTVVQEDFSDAGWKEAFLHPKASHGVLVQLAEWDEHAPMTTWSLEDVLAAPS